jgi:hypothetical protein
MHHQGQEGSSRKLIWVEGEQVAGRGCSECAWVFHPNDWPAGQTLDEVARNFKMQLDEEFTAHNCAEHHQGKRSRLL